MALSLAGDTGKRDPEWLVTSSEIGKRGGRLVVALREEPKSLHPLRAQDDAARTVLAALHADLVHIHRDTRRAEAALAREWKVSPDGRRFTVRLRGNLRFSDGLPLTADDVVASFRAVLDERSAAPQRGLLVLGGRPITVDKLDPLTVQFDLPLPYAAAARLFDGFAILPAARLSQAPAEGGLTGNLPGLGPFRLKEYRPGERLVLERNPFYWKRDRAGQRLPYLDEVIFLFVSSEEAELLRLRSGEIDLVGRLSAASFQALARGSSGSLKLIDLGPSLETHFLFFNLNALPPATQQPAKAQRWFRDVRFRRAISAAVDRQALARLVFHGRATPLLAPVAAGNTDWTRRTAGPAPSPSLASAAKLLAEAGFSRAQDGALLDREGARVEFTVITNAGNRSREQMAAILLEDLRQLGIAARLAPLEFRSLLDRLFTTYDYEACLLGVVSGDADPNPEIAIWTSDGGSQFWALSEAGPPEPWQQEIDRLMAGQLSELDREQRRRQFYRVQDLLAEYLPVIPLVSPHVLVAARADLGNFRPGTIPPYALWNLDELFWRDPPRGASR